MTRLPRVTARQVLAALQRAGFVVIRSRGSHHFLQHKDEPARRTVIAIHSGDVPDGTLVAILRQAGISRSDFAKLL